MLYKAHEWGHAALRPFRLAAEAGSYLLSNPYNPWSYTIAGRAMAAAFEVFENTTRRFTKPAFDLPQTTIDGRAVRVREEILARKPFCQLKHFVRDTTRRDDPRVLVVAPMSGHYATLLRGTVEALLPGHDVYITDWRDARMVPLDDGGFDLDDYIDYVVDYLRILGPNTHIMAVCQPAVPVLAAVALMSEDNDPCAPASMVLMGGPIDTRRNPTVPNDLAQTHSLEWFEQNVTASVPMSYPGAARRVYPGFMQLSGFVAMNLDRHLESHLQLFDHLVEGDGDSVDKHREFYDEYCAVMDLSAEFYLQTVKVVFQDHDLPRGVMTHRGRPIRPGAITKTALMTVEGENDDISGLGQTQAAQDLCTGLGEAQRTHYVQADVGHYGVFNGRRWQAEIAPKVAAFFRTHG